MKSSYTNIPVILFALTAAGCTGETSDGSAENADSSRINWMDSVRSRVDAIHDEAMPKLDEMMQSRSVIRKELERIEEGVKTVSEERRKALEEILRQLEYTDEAMMAWMREHGGTPPDTVSWEMAKGMMEDSYREITEVRDRMDSLIMEANKLAAEIEADSTSD